MNRKSFSRFSTPFIAKSDSLLGLCKQKCRNTCEQEQSTNQGKLKLWLPGVPASRAEN